MRKLTSYEPFEWSGYEWIPTERWGNIHLDKPKWWYDYTAIDITDEWINLKTQYNPHPHFPESLIGAGLISCTQHLKWGTYEIEAKLPEGSYLWPAFWMWGFESWPPEMDILEGYSNKKGSYFKFRWNRPCAFWNVQSNLHKKDATNIRAKTHYFGFKDPSKHFIKYHFVWRPDSIKWYYNDRCVRTVTNKSVLNDVNQHHMNVLLNNGVTNDCEGIPKSSFFVKYFKHTPLY